MESLTITDVTAVLPERVIEHAAVRIDAGVITTIDAGPLSSVTEQAAMVRGDGAYLLPGIVDLHNDNWEFEINPRAGANLPIAFALQTMERRLAAAGVTTEFHAISFQERAQKQRHLADAEVKAALIAGFNDSPARAVRHNVLHRLDVRTPGALERALPSLCEMRVPYVSLNDHAPGQGQYRDVERLIALAHVNQESRGNEATPAEWYRERMRAALADQESVPAFYRRVAEAAAHLPLIISTHDDDTVAKVDQQLAIGATICEFPITIEAARYARHHGMTIVIGAPNVVRGGSQSGNLAAAELIRLGLADAICADYHAPCLLPAAFALADRGLADLPTAVRMISRTPARAVGLTDRGAIAPGLAADLILVRRDREGLPHVEAPFVAGRQTFGFARAPEATAGVAVFPNGRTRLAVAGTAV
ncbi:MAG: alpha-D-ribose 1-methylphosphonate 5-triphosphate diphosphatase [Chloroflexia bacterium]|nr:alpha-D-ribose 1-methylphosphonate 5-triphosphate diphosphatase [Chloroflexia bacterium]